VEDAADRVAFRQDAIAAVAAGNNITVAHPKPAQGVAVRAKDSRHPAVPVVAQAVLRPTEHTTITVTCGGYC